MPTRQLEDLRDEDIGEIVAFVPNKEKMQPILLTFPYYATIAFYNSCQMLEQLEHSTTHINQGNNTVFTLGTWFVSIEAYCNALLKIACILKNKEFNDYKKKPIGPRLSACFELLELDGMSFKKSGLIQKLEEFKLFRNEIFHDRFVNELCSYKKTYFSAIPFCANQVDIMQAAIIALDIFEYLRFVLPGLDLMPSIAVQKNSSYGFFKYDVLYREVMSPLFRESLKKHNLETDLDIEPNGNLLDESKITSHGEVKICIKSTCKISHPPVVNKDKTNIGKLLMNKASEKIKIDTEKEFQIPNYTR